MRRARAWKQQALRYRAKDGTWRGGARPNAGRKPKGAKAGVPHLPRKGVIARHPVHVTLRLAPDFGNLRRRSAYKAIRRATIVTARKDDARIVHLSIQSNHLHLIVEASNAAQLGEGMRRFAISAARQLNVIASSERGVKRTGRVFTDRYHATVIDSPKQARNVLAYVLNNWRHHGCDQTAETRRWNLDPFSSAIHFRGWRGVPDEHVWPIPIGYEPLAVRDPRSWLLREGWRHCGLISLAEVPAAHRPAKRST